MKIKKIFLAGLVSMSLAVSYPSAAWVTAEEISEEDAAELLEGTFRPSDTVMVRQDKYEYPFLGLSAVLPEGLMEKMDSREVAMLCEEKWNGDFTAVEYAYLSWSRMTEEQRDAEVEKLGDGYEAWVSSLERIGTLGMYRKELAEKLDELTGCTEHEKLGESEDGAYQYYLSVAPGAGRELTEEIRQIRTELTERAPLQETSVFDEPYEGGNVGRIGEFTTEDIQGKTYTEEIFQDRELTMVNVFTTWCSPCVKEIPDLEKLREEMADRGVGVVGIVLDAVDEKGETSGEAIEKAKLLAEKTGASYPFLVPDSTMLSGRLNGINTFPETFFVDQKGNIVGETYSGSRSLEEWRDVVETELDGLKGEES